MLHKPLSGINKMPVWELHNGHVNHCGGEHQVYEKIPQMGHLLIHWPSDCADRPNHPAGFLNIFLPVFVVLHQARALSGRAFETAQLIFLPIH